MRTWYGVGCPENIGSPAPSEPSPTPTIQDIMELEPFAPLEPGSYSIDPDGDPSTPLRVVYEVPVEGWSQWIGAAKFADDGHVGVSITTVTNLVRHGCHDHSWADPPVGPGVNDLAAALADLAPFQVTSPPRDVAVYGYRRGAPEADRARSAGRGRGRTTATSPDARKASSRAGSRSSTPPKKGMRTTATRAVASRRSSGSSTSRGPV